MRTRKITLDEAARTARHHHLIGDYYELDSVTRDKLNDLAARTAWRQSRSSASLGHSRLYAFHQALKRRPL